MRQKYLLLLVFFCYAVCACSQEIVKTNSAEIRIGLRFQHTYQLYTENGISCEILHPNIVHNRLGIGITYISSRLGTAIKSNALKQDNFMASATWYFRSGKFIQPNVRINSGWFHADYEYDIFNNLQNNALLLSIEPGIMINKPGKLPFNASISFGYNLITGNGKSGSATVYPLFYQFSLFYCIH